MVTKEIDILMISETKLDDFCPVYQFLTKSFCTTFLDKIKIKTFAGFFFASEAI